MRHKTNRHTIEESKMKKCISIILSLICMLSLFTAAGCRDDKQEEQSATQQTFSQADLIRCLDDLWLTSSSEYALTEPLLFAGTQVSDDLFFCSELYELYRHIYTIYGGEEETATSDEVIGLFTTFDEEVFAEFVTFYKWWMHMDGRVRFNLYYEASKVAKELYSRTYGKDFRPGKLADWSLEDRIALEDFIRENPDFMPVEEYEKELRRLGILTE